MGPVGLHHVGIKVRNVEACVHFYVDVLGLKVRPDRPQFSFDGAWLEVGSQQVHLIEGEAPDDLGQHFALTFPDLAEVVARLRGAGLEVTGPAASGSSLQAFVIDPGGNRVELRQPAPANS